MPVSTILSNLEHSGLIHPAQLEPELEYLFKHALVQEAAYASVLRTDRKTLHWLVGTTLEKLYADRLGELAAVLGQHFSEAGEVEKAVRYLKLAGESAARQYALHEAIGHFSRVLELLPDLAVQTARGQAYSTLGAFDQAREDFEAVILRARETGDLPAACRALLEMGALWAERDYQRTGEYYQQAYRISARSQDLALQAQTLNRLGNWHINQDEPGESTRYHLQALEIFEKLADESGIAATYDFLGMTTALGGDFLMSLEYYSKAMALFRKLGEAQLLSSSLATIQLAAPTHQSDVVICPKTSAEALSLVDESVRLARSVHWAAGEAFALGVSAQVLTYCGEYTRSLEAIQASLEIAQSIQHEQWILAAQVALGCWHVGLLDFPRAAQAFEKAYLSSQRLGSTHWMRVSGGLLASVKVALGQFAQAQSLVDELAPLDSPMVSIAQRLAWFARLDLFLAQGDSSTALQLLAQIELVGPRPVGQDDLIIRLELSRARAWVLSARWAEAITTLSTLIPYLQKAESLPALWRAYALLAEAQTGAGQLAEAAGALAQARRLLETLVEKIPTPERTEFINRPAVQAVWASQGPERYVA